MNFCKVILYDYLLRFLPRSEKKKTILRIKSSIYIYHLNNKIIDIDIYIWDRYNALFVYLLITKKIAKVSTIFICPPSSN